MAVVAGLVAILVASFLFGLATGPSSLDVVDTLSAILWPGDASRSTLVIVWDVRMPAAIMAVLVGVGLSLAGAEMQTILNNPLASPFTLGVSSAALLGAALAIGLPGVPASWIITGNAFIFAFASVLLLQSLTRLRGAGVDSLVMFGIALVFTFNALVALIQFVASADALQQLVFWGMGSLTRANWESLTILGLVIVLTVPFSFRASWKLTALRLGEDRARSFGVNVARLRFFWLFRIVGDETALSVIARTLEALPATAKGVAIIEVADENEQQPSWPTPGMVINRRQVSEARTRRFISASMTATALRTASRAATRRMAPAKPVIPSLIRTTSSTKAGLIRITRRCRKPGLGRGKAATSVNAGKIGSPFDLLSRKPILLLGN